MSEFGMDFDLYPNRGPILFPKPVRDPHGRPGPRANPSSRLQRGLVEQSPVRRPPRGITEPRPSMWLSYVPLDAVLADGAVCSGAITTSSPCRNSPGKSRKSAAAPRPRAHGARLADDLSRRRARPAPGHARGGSVPMFRAGAAFIPRPGGPRGIVRYRSPEPILSPETDLEREGIVNNVVFPTAIDYSSDSGANGWGDVYYGMADARIGVARFRVPATLPQ